jgi:hypothetical protein
MFRTLSAMGALVLAVAGGSKVVASILAEESFDYGTTAGALDGNGGVGFSTAWDAPGLVGWTYTPAGLTLGSLSVSGGAAAGPTVSGSTVSSATRAFNSAPGGTIYGAYLFRVNESPLAGTASVILGQSFEDSLAGTLSVKAVASSAGVGSVQIENSTGFLSGSPVVVGETILALFKFDTTSKTANAWFLNAAQYDNFITSNLDEALLNAAPTGTTATDVLQRGSTSSAAMLGVMSNLNLSVFDFLPTTIDEIRLSDASLFEAAPPVLGSAVIPEPASVVAWTVVAAIAAPAAVFAQRRRAAVG